MKAQPRCVGIDLSLRSVGLSCLVSVNADTHTSKTARVQPNVKTLGLGPRRLVYIRDSVLEFVEEYVPAAVVIEHYAFGARNQAHQLGELGGVIRLALHEMGYGYYNCAPGTLKRFVTGKGNAPKDIMIKGVYKEWGFDTNSNDEADAYALSWIARAVVTKDVRTQLMTVAKVNKLLTTLSYEPGA